MIEKMIREARSQRASDIHISEGQAVYLRIDGKLIKSDVELSDEMTRKLILSLLTKERQESIWRGEDADFARAGPAGPAVPSLSAFPPAFWAWGEHNDCPSFPHSPSACPAA